MLSPLERQFIARRIRTLQIVVGSIAAGSVVFLIIAVVQIRPIMGNGVQLPLLDYAGWAIGAASVIAWIGVPPLITARGRQRIAAGRALQADHRGDAPPELELVEALVGLLQIRLIVGSALLEGAVFCNALVYGITGTYVSLAVALGALLLMLTQFPTRGRAERWTEYEKESIQAVTGP